MASGVFNLRAATGAGTSHTGTFSPNVDATIVFNLNAGGIGVNATGAGPWNIRLALDTSHIVVDGIPLSYAGLPSGFRPLTTNIRWAIGGGFSAADIWLQHDALSELLVVDSGGPIAPSDGFTFRYPYDFTIFPRPTMLDVLNNGLGIRVSAPAGGIQIVQLIFEGTYTTESFVWYDAGLDDYIFGEADPNTGGTAYVLVDAITPRIDSITPDHGTIHGGTAVTITGGGFLDIQTAALGVESVIFNGGLAATSVVVIDQHTLTCVTPAHWRGPCDVVVNVVGD